MPVSYLSSIATSQSYAAKALFDSELHFPELTAEQLPVFLDNAERLLLLDQKIKLSVDGSRLDLLEMARHGIDREGAVILTGIADALPRAFQDRPDVEVRDMAFYEVAGLICSPDFWQAAEQALKETVNRGTTGGDRRLSDASQLGMNVTLAKDGNSLECHLSATWKEFTAGGKWHAMTDLAPVVKANVRMQIPLKRKGDSEELQPRFVSLHTTSPVPEIAAKLREQKATLGQSLLNALARIPLLGRLFRGVQIKVRVGADFRGHGIACMPADLSDMAWLGAAHERKKEDCLAACTHITMKRLTRQPNGIRQLTGAMAVQQAADAGPLPLKVLLNNRPAEARVKAHLLGAAYQGGLNPPAGNPDRLRPQQDAPFPPDDIPPPPIEIPPPIDAVPNALESQLQALQRSLEMEQQARQQADTDREALRTTAEELRQQLSALQQERLKLQQDFEAEQSKFTKAHTALIASQTSLVDMPPGTLGKISGTGVRERAQSFSASRHTKTIPPASNTTTTTTSTADATPNT
ncbi:OmpH family outer membrane protein [Cupriavidus respiraculi]|uniref:Uncharacterized protein n=1 Tax=Cupriavidus respiraculi TaxID=195930 RepID=A0ABN7YK19_9BURK|nr:OmpH family outer membrane protein [Cupriavidus respiraculi]CAG9173388.1 hypothetical protein LMG21510_02247 [Cupriavidus respiraculi]